MKREEAINIVRNIYQTDAEREALATLIPELAESKDERIRKALLKYFSEAIKHESDAWLFEFGIENKDVIAYLEKQKIGEYPLCETIKDKIKCYIANHFIADKVVTTDIPSIVHAMEEGVRLGKEEQNTSPLVQIVENNKAIVEDIRNGVPTKTIEETRGVKFATPIGKEQKPAEEHCDLTEILVPPQLSQNNQWSEEDEDFINMLILHFNYLIDKGGNSVETYKSYREKLKSLRPQPHWKPSEEQMYALEEALAYVNANMDCYEPLLSLYNDLKNL